MSERDDDRALRAAFARLREYDAARAPTLAQLIARADTSSSLARSRRWLRAAFPLAGAAAAGFVWWLSAGAPPPASGVARSRAPQQIARERRMPSEPPIALGSLHSPTDVLLAAPLPLLAPGFSRSLIPAPRGVAKPRSGDQSLTSARRFPA